MPPFGLQKPNVPQAKALALAEADGVREIMLDGAIRSGKTQVGAEILVQYALAMPATYVVFRKTYLELRDSTKKAIMFGDADMPPVLPREAWKDSDYHATDNIVKIAGGSEILFRSAEDPFTGAAKIRNVALGGFLIDQVEELEHDDYLTHFYRTLLGRLSDPRGPRRGVLIANPGPETHWVYRRLVDEETRADKVGYVHFTLHDNKENLTPDYYEDTCATKHTAPEWFDRFVDGKWGAFEGKRFKCWRPEKHIVDPFIVPPEWEITEGIDFGYAHPFCCMWHAAAPCGHEFFVAEHYERRRPISYHARRIKEIRANRNLAPSATWLDPSAWSDRGEFESPAFELADYDISAGKAQNDRIGGWNRLDELLMKPLGLPDGTCSCPPGAGPRLRVLSTCVNLIRELPNLKIKDGTDDVEKRHDDSPDAGRYVVMSRPFFTEPETDFAGDDRMSRYVRHLKTRAKEDQRDQLVTGG